MFRTTRINTLFLTVLVVAGATAQADDSIDEGWRKPPVDARLRAYWWWLNGNVTREAITKDLEWMKAIGMGGGLVFDAGGDTQDGHAPVPAGPLFGSPPWRALFVHALREADRLGLEMGLNLQSGWNLGGPMVTPEKATKLVSWSHLRVQGPSDTALALPQPPMRQRFYRDTFVLAYRLKPERAAESPSPTASSGRARKKQTTTVATDSRHPAPIQHLKEKSAFDELGGSATDCTSLLDDCPATPGEEDVLASAVLDLTDKLDKDGTLHWSVPAGNWLVLRFGYTNNGEGVSTASGKWSGLVIDYLDAEALRWYWRTVVDPIIADAGPAVGRSWKMVQTDSWELGGVNWTANFPAEFQHRRGYDLRPWLPVLAGQIVDSRFASNRFLADLRRTVADCVAENHYGTMAALAHAHGLGIQPESAGPHTAPLDGLMCYGRSDWPMSEFWVPSPHRPRDEDRFFVKQAASAAHIYGRSIVCAEGFTSIGPQWNDTLWSAQKPSFDHEACAGLNLVFWHAFTCSPKEAGLPGQEYFAGTHFNPQITWAKQAAAFVHYLNRCQFLLQQGQFVADVLYYYGNHVPNIARLKKDDPARVLPAYDYDVVNEEVLLRATVADGCVVLPSGMAYRVLVLPKARVLSLEAARKIYDLVEGGATIVGPKPWRTTGRQDEARLGRIADELWDTGRIQPRTAREALAALGVGPDVEGIPDWIHHRCGEADIYFVSNQGPQSFRGDCRFRVHGKQPELWDAVTGDCRPAAAFQQTSNRTSVPLELPPYGSLFVVFRKPVNGDGAGRNFDSFTTVGELTGPWTVAFDSRWGAPSSVDFQELIDWTARPEDAIRFYSGTATYRRTFDAPKTSGRLLLDLGALAMLAEVRLNGQKLGVVWFPPFRVDITRAVKPTGNVLEVDVVNTWYNRLVKDLSLPQSQRLTHTNIRLNRAAKPMPSGLLGPVRLLTTE
jgi:hypothetical protein